MFYIALPERLMPPLAMPSRVASLHLILEAPGVRMWYHADLTPAGLEERHTADEQDASPLALAIFDAALAGARDTVRGIEAAMQLHLPGVDPV